MAKTSRTRAPEARPTHRDPAASTPAAARRPAPRWLAVAAAAALFPATMLYAPSVANPVVWDDELHVPLATSLETAETFGTAGGEYRRPLVLWSYAAQARLGLASPAALHLGNALLHGINAAFVVLVVGSLLPPSFVSGWASGSAALVGLAAGILFAGHPVQSGSVAYVSGRTDVLATFFLLLAVWPLARPRPDLGPAGATTAWGGWPAAAFATAAVVAAGLAKESGLVAGPAAAAVLWWRRADGDRSIRIPHLAAPLLAALTTAVLVMPAAATNPVPILVRLRGAGTALATYAGLLVRPHDLHLDRLTPLGPPAAAALGAVALVAAVVVVVRFLRSPSRPLLAAVALVLLLAPGSGLVPVYPAIADRYVFTGEQFLYTPMVVLAAAFAVVAARVLDAALPRLLPNDRWRRLAPERQPATLRDTGGGRSFTASPGAFGSMLVAMTLLLAWMPAVLERQLEFSSAEQVYRKTLAHSPSPRACFNLGGLYLERREYREALATYEQCVAIAPGDAAAHGQRAIALQQLGRSDDARRAYERSLALDDGNARVWSNFATLEANAGRYDEARVKWERALTLDPGEQAAAEALRRLELGRR